jgi:hypothetical protein
MRERTVKRKLNLFDVFLFLCYYMHLHVGRISRRRYTVYTYMLGWHKITCALLFFLGFLSYNILFIEKRYNSMRVIMISIL